MFLNVLNFCRVNELNKLNQIDIPDHWFYVDCKPKVIVGLTFLEIILCFNVKFPKFKYHFLEYVFKRIKFLSSQRVH